MHVCVCVQVRVWCAGVCVCVCMSMCADRKSTSCIGLQVPPTSCSLAWRSHMKLGYLVTEPQESACLCLPSSGITSPCHNSQCFMWVLGLTSGPYAWTAPVPLIQPSTQHQGISLLFSFLKVVWFPILCRVITHFKPIFVHGIRGRSNFFCV